MARRKSGEERHRRAFRPEALSRYASPSIRAPLGVGAVVWRYTVVVPIEELRPRQRPIATTEDLQDIEEMLPEHFGGLTTLAPSTGYGPRNPKRPADEPQMNFNTYFVVYAAPVRQADEYFQALQKELQEALGEGLILVERQDVVLL